MVLRRKTLIARRLRRDSTAAERRLWRALRALGLAGKVRRQHPIGGHVVDIAIPAHWLAIKIDGGQHAALADADAARTAVLNACGYLVIRFWNNEVFESLPGVLERIEAILEGNDW